MLRQLLGNDHHDRHQRRHKGCAEHLDLQQAWSVRAVYIACYERYCADASAQTAAAYQALALLPELEVLLRVVFKRPPALSTGSPRGWLWTCWWFLCRGRFPRRACCCCIWWGASIAELHLRKAACQPALLSSSEVTYLQPDIAAQSSRRTSRCALLHRRCRLWPSCQTASSDHAALIMLAARQARCTASVTKAC